MEFSASELWSRALLAAKASMPEQSFRTWLSGSIAVGLSEGELIVEAPSAFHVEWVEDKYGDLLREILRNLLGRPIEVVFRSTGAAYEGSPPPAVEVGPSAATATADSARDVPAQADKRTTHLNERYTFERFVVGNNNQLASAASHAVAEQPARIYNPLFLYGGVGLGKTHLMHAVGHAVLEKRPHAQIAYVTTEQFMNELVTAIQQGTTPAFRRRFRQIDLLLVDDVHFLEKKESTQEEFFHTFNTLYDAGKQIILTSDRPPKELPGLEERLVSRFEWGLVADIKPPDYETRVAILQKKAGDDRLVLDPDVIDFVARSCTSSVRELEGAVIKLLAYSSLRNEEISLELARIALQSILRGGIEGRSPLLSADRILDRVAREWGVTPDGVMSKKRTKELTVPRQVTMYLIKDLLDESLVRIGRHFGGRDHSTVIHSIRKVDEDMKEDPAFALRVERLREEMRGRE
jgi:chromosomal replication initiator protein